MRKGEEREKQYKETFGLEMSFSEALGRFANVKKEEVPLAPIDEELEEYLKQFYDGGERQGDAPGVCIALQAYLKKHGNNDATEDYCNKLYARFLNNLT